MDSMVSESAYQSFSARQCLAIKIQRRQSYVKLLWTDYEMVTG
jgi:hypothetical protein